VTTAELRRARRLFVATEHPDRGGDAARFQAGLANFDALLHQLPGTPDPSRTAGPGPAVRVTVVRRPHGLLGWLHHLRGRHLARRPRASRVR